MTITIFYWKNFFNEKLIQINLKPYLKLKFTLKRMIGKTNGKTFKSILVHLNLMKIVNRYKAILWEQKCK